MSQNVLTRPSITSEVMTAELLTDHFPGLAPIVGNRAVYLMRADLSGPSGSFKDFGVADVMADMSRKGLKEASTASAGSHALAMLQPAAELGMHLHLLLPTIASREKVAKIHEGWRELGQDPDNLRVTLEGADLDETLQYVAQHVDPDTFVHAYDNRAVIEGRREIRRSALRAIPELTDFVVPVGGGSMFTAMTMDGNTWGVEAEGSDSLSRTLRVGSDVPLRASSPNDKFGGCTVRYTGENVVTILHDYPEAASRLLTVTNDEVRSIAGLYLEHEPDTPLEPTSLVAVAGLREVLARTPKEAVIGVMGTGHNESYKNLLAS